MFTIIICRSTDQLETGRDLEDGEIDSADSPTKSTRWGEGSHALDSPASPDLEAAMVTGSPVRIIPASPPHRAADESSKDEDTGGEEEEDIDEDILYLRLIALRSMAAEGSQESREQQERTKEKQELAKEMQELIDEAEEAASYELIQNAG